MKIMITVWLFSSLMRLDLKKENMLILVCSEAVESKLIGKTGDQLFSDTPPYGDCSLVSTFNGVIM